MVSYEVTVTLGDPGRGAEFADWMASHHIPGVLGTGCFAGAEFAQLDGTTFRTRYLARTQADLDRYLAGPTEALRADFARAFPDASASRQIWQVMERFPDAAANHS